MKMPPPRKGSQTPKEKRDEAIQTFIRGAKGRRKRGRKPENKGRVIRHVHLDRSDIQLLAAERYRRAFAGVDVTTSAMIRDAIRIAFGDKPDDPDGVDDSGDIDSSQS